MTFPQPNCSRIHCPNPTKRAYACPVSEFSTCSFDEIEKKRLRNDDMELFCLTHFRKKLAVPCLITLHINNNSYSNTMSTTISSPTFSSRQSEGPKSRRNSQSDSIVESELNAYTSKPNFLI